MTLRANDSPTGCYLAAAATGHWADGSHEFTDDLRYIVPGRNALSGVRQGAQAPASYFADVQRVSGNSYRVTLMERLTGGDRSLLVADESMRVGANDIAWRRCVLCDGRERVSRVNVFESDQRTLDEAMPTDSGPIATSAFGESVDVGEGAPIVRGNTDDPRVKTVIAYQAAMARGDIEYARGVFAPNVEYRVAGRHQLAGLHRGPDAVMGYFGRLTALTGGSYRISAMDWLAGEDSIGLVTRNHARRNGTTLAWDEIIRFTFVDGRKSQIELFPGDPYGVDMLLA